ncbi:hypothetical protein K437DRAFT_294491 [Tilletiaria anomala UBC 951]|uniref:Glycerophosphocholine acyltransferase 1 n=1 Tax=Tilletiaria anomala (strain ATCC 24038 / CBS 436.72 / UBC 951) TaxID=1037660 RepID=A0A066VWA2_TILAU|nr:uncharacterized protein K437DRAFT_294491 [Tilletiaria anomala UBC 951]KDN45756.1 hypothetical protein K437DRAFT_294491 [Tilletiaria anomala UBC 951]
MADSSVHNGWLPGPESDNRSPTCSESMSALSRSSSMQSASTHDGIDLMEGASGLPLADLLETFWDSRVDLLDRKLKTLSEEVKFKAKQRRDKLVQRAKGQKELKALQKEAEKLRQGVVERVEKLSERWSDAKMVRTRDKVSFVIGVMNLVISSLIFALRPEWLATVYTIQCLYFLPIRIFTYTRKKWHYFLFDFCYFLNVANLVFIWLMPQSKFLLTVCYCAAHGPLAAAIPTWRNSMTFHSLDKMTSLFIHLYPLLVFVAIRHFIPPDIAYKQYPALAQMVHLNSFRTFFFNVGVYIVWQSLYYVVMVPRRFKIESGERTNSYSTLSQGKGAVANLLSKAKPQRREPAFMLLQFVYTIITTLPAPLLFYRSKTASAVLVLFVLLMSVINGASYYVEVWGRRFEKELIALRKELEAARSADQAVKSALEDSSDLGNNIPPPSDSASSDVTVVEAKKDK